MKRGIRRLWGLFGVVVGLVLSQPAFAQAPVADACDRALVTHALEAPFSGWRALAAHEALIEWPAHGTWTARSGVLPFFRDGADEAEYSRLILRQQNLQNAGVSFARLITVDAPQQELNVWLGCKRAAGPGVQIYVKSRTATGIMVGVMWTPPPGAPPGLVLESWLEGSWRSAVGPRPTAFAAYKAENAFVVEQAFEQDGPTQANMALTVRVGSYLDKIEIPAMAPGATTPYPRARDALPLAQSYTDAVLPAPGGRLPGEHLWTTTGGCHVAVSNARRPITAAQSYRYDWTGACKDGWISGPGTLREITPTEEDLIKTGVFDQGELITGDEWFIGAYVDNPSQRGFFHFAVKGGRLTQQGAIDRDKAPADLVRIYDNREQRFASQQKAADRAASGSGSGWVLAMLKGLTVAMDIATVVIDEQHYNRQDAAAQAQFNAAQTRADSVAADAAIKRRDKIFQARIDSRIARQQDQDAQKADRAYDAAGKPSGEPTDVTADGCFQTLTDGYRPSSPTDPTRMRYLCRTSAVIYLCAGDNISLRAFQRTGKAQACTVTDRVSYGSTVLRKSVNYIWEHPLTPGWNDDELVCFTGSTATMVLNNVDGRNRIAASCEWN